MAGRFHDWSLNIENETVPVASLHAVDMEPGRDPYSQWHIARPDVQSIDVTHLYPLHGQFADWEGPKPYPAYIQEYNP